MGPKQAFWSEGSSLEYGGTEAGVIWKDSQGCWMTRGFSLGRGQEILGAETLGIVQALHLARNIGGWRSVTVIFDSQAAISKLQHTQPGPGPGGLNLHSNPGPSSLGSTTYNPVGSRTCCSKGERTSKQNGETGGQYPPESRFRRGLIGLHT